MKKIAALLLVATMVLSLAACGSKPAETTTTKAPETTTKAPETTTAKPAETTTAKPAETTTAKPAESTSAPAKVSQPADYKGTVSFIAPSKAGGSTDLISRALISFLNLGTGVNTVVEDIAGGNQTTACTEIIVNRPADGKNVLMVCPAGLVSQPLIMGDELKYKVEDMRFLANAAPLSTAVVIVKPDSKLQTADDFMNLIKSTDQFSYSCPAIGGYAQVSFSSLMLQLGYADGSILNAVQYTGSANVMQAVQNGEVEFGIIDAEFVLPYAQQGQVKMLLTLYDSQNPILPDLPYTGQYGITGMNVCAGFKLFAVRKDTPAEVVDWLKQQIAEVVANPEYLKAIDNTGVASIIPMTEEECTQFVKDCVEAYRSVLKAVGQMD